MRILKPLATMFLHIVSRHAQYAIRSRTGHSLFVTTDYGHPERLFFKNLELLVLGRHFGLTFFWGIWGIFGQTISTRCGTCPCFPFIQPLFLQKTKPLYPTPKYLFGNGILIWAAKNSKFSLRVSVVRVRNDKISHLFGHCYQCSTIWSL